MLAIKESSGLIALVTIGWNRHDSQVEGSHTLHELPSPVPWPTPVPVPGGVVTGWGMQSSPVQVGAGDVVGAVDVVGSPGQPGRPAGAVQDGVVGNSVGIGLVVGGAAGPFDACGRGTCPDSVVALAADRANAPIVHNATRSTPIATSAVVRRPHR